MTRAPWVAAEAVAGVPDDARADVELGARLADGQPEDAGGVDGRARRGRRDPGRRVRRSHARSRTRSRSRRTNGGRRRGRRARSTAEVDRGAGRRARRATSASATTRSLESLAKLKPAFREGGTVTAGNSSPMNDGAAALLLASPTRRRAGGHRADGTRRQPRDERSRAPPLRHRAGRRPRARALQRAGSEVGRHRLRSS